MKYTDLFDKKRKDKQNVKTNTFFGMPYETPFDLAAVLTKVNEHTEPHVEFIAEQQDGGCIDIILNNKLVASFYDDGDWSVWHGLYNCGLQDISIVFDFLYKSDKNLWFEKDK